MPVRHTPTLESAIWVAKSVEEMIKGRTTNKVEAGEKRKFEGSTRSNKSNVFSKSGEGRGEAKLCEKCKKKHSGKRGKKVACFKHGKTGHYTNEYTFNKRVCYGCNEDITS